jgi:hypothetical protein
MTQTSYLTPDEVFARNDHMLPTRLDCLDFEYEGVRVHSYGVLHALTGGTNRAYVRLVNDTLRDAPGLKLGEKGMRAMYKGLDGELDDWLPVPLVDAFRFPLALLGTPVRFARVFFTVLKEYLTKEDRFCESCVPQLYDIGGSAAFHLMSPDERRELAGFPDTPTYLLENLLRRKGKGTLKPIQFPDPDWWWLRHVEKYVNIPCRSVHMLEFAVTLARLKGVDEVSLFIGETHQSDTDWYRCFMQGEAEFPAWAADELGKIRLAARAHAVRVFEKRFTARKVAYLGAMYAGIALPVAAYTAVANWLFRL